MVMRPFKFTGRTLNSDIEYGLGVRSREKTRTTLEVQNEDGVRRVYRIMED